MRRGVPILHWRDRPMLIGGVSALMLGGLTLALVVPLFAQRLRPDSTTAGSTPTPPPVDGERAYKYLRQICAIGPRPAGSAANEKQRSMVAAHFKQHGATIVEQPFTGRDPQSGERVRMVNLVGSWHPDRKERVVIGVHYDTRPFPDEESDPNLRATPFLGANDGASGVALLMEMAHQMNELATPWGVDLVLFDGEELVYGQNGDYFLGSKEFARVYVEGVEGRRTPNRYHAGLVLDMVGGKNLQINQEPYSLDLASRLVKDVWAVARRLKATAFKNRTGRAVLDDHLPLNNGGIPTIDIIDFDYPYWHKAKDLPENCSAASLAQVGRVVTAWLMQPKPKRR